MLHAVTVAQVTDVNESIRILRLDINAAEIGANVSVVYPFGSTSTDSFKFRPGQWLNIHLDGLEVSRGHGIISTPGAALAARDIAPGSKPCVEVIIQNAPTIQMQRRQAEVFLVVGTQLNISFGGSFVWPPNSARTTPITRVVFLAGGVGVSPLVSMLSHIFETNAVPQEVHFLYASRVKGYYYVSHVLGLERLISISKAHGGKFYLYLFFGGHPSRTLMEAAVPRQRFEPRVTMDTDVLDIFRNFEFKHTTVCYVAGPPDMTSHFVELLQEKVGMDASRVLYEQYESEASQVYTADKKV